MEEVVRKAKEVKRGKVNKDNRTDITRDAEIGEVESSDTARLTVASDSFPSTAVSVCFPGRKI